jgi:hypothetical protein
MRSGERDRGRKMSVPKWGRFEVEMESRREYGNPVWVMAQE